MVEQEINGKPDLIVIGEDKRVAVEIETGKSDAVANVEKNLKAGFDEIVCVAVDDKAETVIREQLKKLDLGKSPKVKLVSVRGFDCD